MVVSIGNGETTEEYSIVIKGDTSAVLFDRVDQAMYEAKSNGRNCVIVK